MWNRIITYLKSIISANDENSSKRFLSIMSWGVWVIIIILGFCGVILPDIYIYANLSIILGNSGLSVLEKFITKK